MPLHRLTCDCRGCVRIKDHPPTASFVLVYRGHQFPRLHHANCRLVWDMTCAVYLDGNGQLPNGRYARYFDEAVPCKSCKPVVGYLTATG